VAGDWACSVLAQCCFLVSWRNLRTSVNDYATWGRFARWYSRVFGYTHFLVGSDSCAAGLGDIWCEWRALTHDRARRLSSANARCSRVLARSSRQLTNTLEVLCCASQRPALDRGGMARWRSMFSSLSASRPADELTVVATNLRRAARHRRPWHSAVLIQLTPAGFRAPNKQTAQGPSLRLADRTQRLRPRLCVGLVRNRRTRASGSQNLLSPIAPFGGSESGSSDADYGHIDGTAARPPLAAVLRLESTHSFASAIGAPLRRARVCGEPFIDARPGQIAKRSTRRPPRVSAAPVL